MTAVISGLKSTGDVVSLTTQFDSRKVAVSGSCGWVTSADEAAGGDTFVAWTGSGFAGGVTSWSLPRSFASGALAEMLAVGGSGGPTAGGLTAAGLTATSAFGGSAGGATSGDAAAGGCAGGGASAAAAGVS